MGFVSYLSDLSFDSFQTTKRHSYDGYSIYMPSFNQFLPMVYPVGVIDLRPLFTQKSNHNSVNLYQIPTKIGKKMRFTKALMCIKFQLNLSMHLSFIGENTKCAEWRIRRKKWRKYFKILLTCISGLAGTIYFEFGM